MPNVPCMTSPNLSPTSRSSFNPRTRPEADRLLAPLAASSQGKLIVPDMFRFLCPKGDYQQSLGDVRQVRVDGVHYTPDGADLAARFLIDEVRKGSGVDLSAPAG